MNALLIDDSVTIRHLVKRMLQEGFPGCQVTEAADGKAAIRALTQQRVDLIVTDLEMPGMDGRRFLSTLRGNPLLRRKSVVVLSSAISADLVEELRGVDNVVLVHKPATSSSIKAAVERVMAQSSVGELSSEP